MTFHRDQLLLYAVTDRSWTGSKTLCEQIECALQGGVTIVQLREKNMPEADFINEAIQVRKLCNRYGVPLIINDNLTVALESGADGVHVGVEDQPVAEIRHKAGKDFIIGATAKTVAQAQKAEKDSADYLGVGAIFPSSTKTNAIRITREQLCSVCSSVSIPAVAIGGIDQYNIQQLTGTPIAGVALVSAIFSSNEIEAACKDLLRSVKQIVNHS